MAQKIRIGIILGSTRESRFGEKPARWIFGLASRNGEVDAELLDLRDYPLPFYDEPLTPSKLKSYKSPVADRWAKKIDGMDAYIIVTPEYNHGYPAVLKNALDYAYFQWNRKPVGFVSWGGAGGTRSVEQLRQVSVELQMAPIRNAVHIQSFWTLLDPSGNLKPGAIEAYDDAAGNMLEQLLWWAKALKAARG